MPLRFLQASFTFVFEKFVNWRKYDTGAFRIDPHVKIEFVVEKIDVAMAQDAEKLSGHIEIAGVNDSVADRKFRASGARNAIAGTRHNVIEDL